VVEYDRERGRLIKLARINCGLNQTQLARLVGCSRSSISYYEKGREFPYRIGVKLSRALGISQDQLNGIDSFLEIKKKGKEK